MQCERCKVNQATVHVTTIIDGQKVEMYLCEQCAKETESLYINNISFQDFLTGLLDMKNLSSFSAKEMNNAMCPMCNMTYNEFRKTGKFGCAACYATFSNNLEPIFKRIHGGIYHTGKLPQRTEGKLKVKRKIKELKEQLKVAVEKEEFELAATLRDQIREIERG